MEDEPVASAADAVAALRSAVDGLLAAALTPLAGVEVTELLGAVEVQRRRLEAVDQRLIAEIGERGIAGEYARSSGADLLVTLLRIAPGEARARIHRARDMGPRRAVTGEALEPIFARVAAAHRDGLISAGHADVITHCVERIPAAVAGELAPVVEQALVVAATHVDPRQLGRDAEQLLARIDQNGPEPRDREGRRHVTLHTRSDGSGRLTGELTPASAAALTAVLDALSAPIPSGENGEPDQRSAGQRRHDGLHEAMLRLLRAGTMPDSGGVPATILATVTVDDLLRASGCARTGHGDTLPIRDLRSMSCDADVITTILDTNGAIMSYGRTRRLASPTQRLALAARDGGCSFPGCDRPASWCEAHHVIAWQDGGPTDLDNMTLLCGFHHRAFERCGWTVHMSDGVPQWIPPPWLDPDQQPRRNTAHHRPDITFDLGLLDPPDTFDQYDAGPLTEHELQ